MSGISDVVDRAIAMVAEGTVVDWDALFAEAHDDIDRAFLADLRLLTALGAPGPARSRLTVDSRWQHLRILDHIGSGASGEVYRAWDTHLEREVALKLISSGDPDSSISEARRLARISHPNIVRIYGADGSNGSFGLWMELLRGQTLEDILRAQGPLSAREATVILIEICGAIAAVHAIGIVHRDIKAQNVIREPAADWW